MFDPTKAVYKGERFGFMLHYFGLIPWCAHVDRNM
jgi:hypothetical protein